jgi:hypothetical protein
MSDNNPELNIDDTSEVKPSQQTSSIADIGGAPTQPDNWKGNADYFQSGKKAGTLRPRAAAKASGKIESFGGLDIESLNPTQSAEQPEQPPAPDKKALKAEKKLVEAKVAAKFVMRILDTLTGWISKGEYGADFSESQRKERNKYRADLEQDWQDYLLTLDIPMHPALVAIFGSVLYVAPAFETTGGRERSQSIKEKIISKIAVGIFSRGK